MEHFKEIIKNDQVKLYLGGRIAVKDCIFQYENKAKDIFFEGDVNTDVSDKYIELDSDVFAVEIGTSEVIDVGLNKEYTSHRLIDIVF